MSLLNNLSQEAQTCKYSCKVISCWKIIYNFIFFIWMKKEWTILLTNLLGSHLWRRTQLSNFTFTFHFHALEKEMVTHSRILAWRIPGTGEPGGLPSIGSQSRTRLKRLSSSSSSNLCKQNYLYGILPFYKIQVNHFMAWDESSGAKIIPKCILWVRGLVPFWVLRYSFLSLTDC